MKTRAGHCQVWRMAGCVVLVIAAIASSAAASAADASPAKSGLAAGWSSPVRLSARGGLAQDPQVALDTRGDAVAVWIGSHVAGNVQGYVVMAAERRRARGWLPRFQLSPAGETALNPEIAVGPAGDAVAVWDGFWPAKPKRGAFVQASFRRKASGRWSRPVRITPVGMSDAGMAQVGIDGHGHAMAIWAVTPSGRRNRIEVSTLTIASGTWSRPVQLAHPPAGQAVWNPQLAVNARGDAVAVWHRPIRGGVPFGGRFAVVAAVKPAGPRPWRQPVVLGTEVHAQGQDSATEEVGCPQVAIDARGGAIVVWQGESGGTIVPEFSSRVAGGRWRAPASISGTSALLPHAGMDSRGDATAVWAGPGGSVVMASKPAAARRWSGPRIFQGDPRFFGPFARIAVSPAGAAIITWEGASVRAAVRPGPNAAWRNPVKLGSGAGVQPAFGQTGSAVVVWQRPVGHSIVIDAAGHGPFRR